MCWTGAHLDPKTGKEKRLPTTAKAQSIDARANFFVLFLFIIILLLKIVGKVKISNVSIKSLRDIFTCGRYFMVSSHAGTRLPIADILNQGRSSSARQFPPFLKVIKKQG